MIAMFTDFSTSSDSSVDKCLTAPEFWTYNPLTSKEVGLGRPVVRRNSRAHSLVSGFFYIPSCAGHGSQFWRAVRDTREGVPVLARSTNLHGLPPSLGRFYLVAMEANNGQIIGARLLMKAEELKALIDLGLVVGKPIALPSHDDLALEFLVRGETAACIQTKMLGWKRRADL